ncbi:hypothetical protein PASE110613_12490 [Paenibacillus sediminis]|uniref:Uncharacterized protein n=1 Tax=Paenibacillus sediminis TaxID=664909 RepID=A0ABS4H5B3_9BACL|nr:hypothetical protein [Paenibacillus sediminis]MBP1937656.1 hypothetical protein [Paenibacillus sediminis]
MNQDYNNIKKIEASIGGYFGSSYKFKADLVNGHISWSTEGEYFEPPIILNMDAEGITLVRNGLRECNILSWDKEYIDHHILDGTQWSLEIQLSEKSIHINGSNAYPPEWKKFCEVVRKLSGKPFD